MSLILESIESLKPNNNCIRIVIFDSEINKRATFEVNIYTKPALSLESGHELWSFLEPYCNGSKALVTNISYWKNQLTQLNFPIILAKQSDVPRR